MKKIAIISSGYFPVPATRGGAVETLIEKLIKSNEENQLFDLEVYSTYDSFAEEKVKHYQNSKIVFVKDSVITDLLDKCIYWLAKKIIKNTSRHMSFRYIMHRIIYIIKTARLLSKADYDYIIIENTATLFWCVKLFGNLSRYKDKIIYHIHNEVGSEFRCEDIISSCLLYLCVSDFIGKKLTERFPTIDSEKIVVYPNCIDVSQMASGKTYRKEIREKYHFSDEDTVFVYAGRLCKEKGVLELLKAFALIDNPHVKLLVIGNYYFGTNLISDFEKNLNNEIKDIQERVVFTGFIHNKDICKYYCAADIAVLPSMWEEPAGLTIVEAMAASLPVITTNSGGIPEYTNCESAIILNKNEEHFIEKLSVAMCDLVQDVNRQQDMKKVAFKRSTMFDYREYAKKLEVLLKNI